MLKNIMPFHGTSVSGNLGALNYPAIDSKTKDLIDKAEDTDDQLKWNAAAEATKEKGKAAFKAKDWPRAFAYFESASGIGDADYASIEYNAGRALEEWAKSAEKKGDLGTAKQAATNAVSWFKMAYDTATATNKVATMNDAQQKIAYMKSQITYIAGLKKDPKTGKVIASKPKPKDTGTTNTDGDTTAAGGSTMAILAGLGLLWWAFKEK